MFVHVCECSTFKCRLLFFIISVYADGMHFGPRCPYPVTNSYTKFLWDFHTWMAAPKKRRTSGSCRVRLSLKDYECPVCMELMLGQIMQCKEGHPVCKGCADVMPFPLKCPTCRGLYPGDTPSRNRVLEEVVGRLTVPCKHGCGLNAKPAAMRVHWPLCPRRPIACPHSDCAVVVPLELLSAHLCGLIWTIFIFG